MAVLTVTDRKHNIVGNKREDIFEHTLSGATEGIVHTTLHWVEHVEVLERTGADMAVNTYKNSDTASQTQDDAGHFFFDNAADTKTYQFRCTGW